MKIPAERKKVEAILDEYRTRLDTLPDDKFDLTPPGGGWSYAEVYSHIMQASLGSTIAMERCTQKTCKPTTKKLNWLGKLIFLFGAMPSVKVKEPAKVAEKMPAQKISKEEARNLIIKCRQRLDHVMPLILDPENEGRVSHPRLGTLSAGQWLKFIGIHLKHHLKQLNRIEKKFSA